MKRDAIIEVVRVAGFPPKARPTHAFQPIEVDPAPGQGHQSFGSQVAAAPPKQATASDCARAKGAKDGRASGDAIVPTRGQVQRVERDRARYDKRGFSPRRR